MNTQRDQAGEPDPRPATAAGPGWIAPDAAGPRTADTGEMRPPPIPTGSWTTAPTSGAWDTLGSGRLPSSRPTYREPHPVRLPALAAGAATTAAWYLLAGMMSWNVRSYAWATIIAGVVAWLAALALTRFGDRGVAAGVAGVSGIALAVVGLVVGIPMFDGEWILW